MILPQQPISECILCGDEEVREEADLGEEDLLLLQARDLNPEDGEGIRVEDQEKEVPRPGIVQAKDLNIGEGGGISTMDKEVLPPGTLKANTWVLIKGGGITELAEVMHIKIEQGDHN